jgi:tRNA U34 5-methylaminomethyl-2-thiouridine-forming methyltransferase MnmC
MYPPREWTEHWAQEHPNLAVLALLFGVGLVCFAVWLVVAG